MAKYKINKGFIVQKMGKDLVIFDFDLLQKRIIKNDKV
jgi:hypothetical protein